MSREKQIDIIRDLLVDFDEMGFVPSVAVPDHEAYAIKWRDKITKALEGYFKQSEWISVDERLPEYGELVLVSSMDLLTKKHGWFYLARYTDTMSNGVRFDEKCWVGEECGLFGRVTHWMPLPEAPKMKGGAE